jgi:hypothetical protein
MASKISSIKHTNAKRARIPGNEEASMESANDPAICRVLCRYPYVCDYGCK